MLRTGNSFTDYLLMVTAFLPLVPVLWIRSALTILLTALLSVVITYWSVKGWGNASPVIGLLMNGCITGVIMVSLSVVIRTGQLQVFRSPLFWIGSGTLFYLLLYLLLETIDLFGRSPLAAPDPDKRLFLALANLVKYLLYSIAVLSCRQPQEERKRGAA